MKLRFFLLVALLSFIGLFNSVQAHELQPSSLEIQQLSKERYQLIWRAPIYYGNTHPATLQLPESWQSIGKDMISKLEDSHLHRRLFTVPNGKIDGSIVRIPGLEATITDVFVRVFWLDGTQTTLMASPNHPWFEIQAQRSSWQVAGDYTLLGVEHILSGYDHLTFVLALILIVSGWRKLLWTITAFTLAHSITLASATLGVLHLPSPPIEATIALSILFLARELIILKQGGTSLTARYPWLVAFIFGLLHGLGFAGALSDVGLPQNEIPLALLTFNVGVELGQLVFVAIVMVLIALLHKIRREWPIWAQQLPAYGIGSLAAFWFIERISMFYQ